MAIEEKSKKKRTIKTPTLLRGFKDILPEESKYWHHFNKVSFSLIEEYGFRELATPILETTSLFKRTLGDHTDIVTKEMFTFEDKGGDSVALRPEFTASLARAYIEHGMFNKPQPIKVYAHGPAFRYERPQAGRFRQFHQLDLEIFGNEHAVADAEIIFLSYLICKKLDIDVVIIVNSLGEPESREEYIDLLKEYYKGKRRLLCDDCKKRLAKNTLRLLDCKEPGCRSLRAEAPQIVDHLDEESKQHFVSVLEHLDESEVPYELDPYLVRGLDYYNRTTFEIIPQFESRAISTSEEQPEETHNAIPDSIGGGGRYDGLISLLGGRVTPGVGMAFGLERVIRVMKKNKKFSQDSRQAHVFLAQLGEGATKHTFGLFETLRQSGLRVSSNFAKAGLAAQLEQADKLGVSYTVILGQKELLDGTVIIRDMENGMQEVVDLSKIAEEMKKRVKKSR
jgi:histidyl-tRNA synthetase